MAKAVKKMVLMVEAMKAGEAIIKIFLISENTRGRIPNKERNIEELKSGKTVKNYTGGQRGSANAGDASSMDEKSSTIGRRDKRTRLATKDGRTGSGDDGQLTE